MLYVCMYVVYMYLCMYFICMCICFILCIYISCICMYVCCMYVCVYVVYLYVYKLYMYVYICTCLYMHEIYSICATSALTSGLNEHGNPMNRINLDKCRKKCERERTSSQNERCIRPVSNRPSVRSEYFCSDNSNQRRQGEKRDRFHEAQHFPPSHFPFQA